MYGCLISVANRANLYYTVKRTVSDFEKEYHIQMGFGQIVNPL